MGNYKTFKAYKNKVYKTIIFQNFSYTLSFNFNVFVLYTWQEFMSFFQFSLDSQKEEFQKPQSI